MILYSNYFSFKIFLVFLDVLVQEHIDVLGSIHVLGAGFCMVTLKNLSLHLLHDNHLLKSFKAFCSVTYFL